LVLAAVRFATALARLVPPGSIEGAALLSLASAAIAERDPEDFCRLLAMAASVPSRLVKTLVPFPS